ncbi:hypothetical protein GWI33_020433 [Rhynchophorus ferrugineus]|uniref:Uncharacterized protein n=1 Tax=Rhynchophorus ferrugineus TaxID=354439 RepID=A0A834M0H6_RHYFE|nr:hypothetical protein GWI33_020433 [Rhynchophorus ferrugineus]
MALFTAGRVPRASQNKHESGSGIFTYRETAAEEISHHKTGLIGPFAVRSTKYYDSLAPLWDARLRSPVI